MSGLVRRLPLSAWLLLMLTMGWSVLTFAAEAPSPAASPATATTTAAEPTVSPEVSERLQALHTLARWIHAFSFFLIALGFIAVFVEINQPGFGIPGFVAVLAFSLFFYGNFLAANAAGWETALIFLLGFILVVVEVVVLAGGSVIFGILGCLLMFGALTVALIDRAHFDAYLRGDASAPSLIAILQGPVLSLLAGLALTTVGIMILMKFLPKTGPFRRLVLQATVPSPLPAIPHDATIIPGAEGIAATDLRPAGKGRFGDALYDVSSGSLFIRRGEPIRVVEVRGDGIVIDRGI